MLLYYSCGRVSLSAFSYEEEITRTSRKQNRKIIRNSQNKHCMKSWHVARRRRRPPPPPQLQPPPGFASSSASKSSPLHSCLGSSLTDRVHVVNKKARIRTYGRKQTQNVKNPKQNITRVREARRPRRRPRRRPLPPGFLSSTALQAVSLPSCFGRRWVRVVGGCAALCWGCALLML